MPYISEHFTQRLGLALYLVAFELPLKSRVQWELKLAASSDYEKGNDAGNDLWVEDDDDDDGGNDDGNDAGNDRWDDDEAQPRG